MNIGLCFSGHLRNVDKCLDNIIENIVNPLKTISNIDCFISTWSVKNCRVNEEPADLKMVIDKLSPVSVNVEPPRAFNTDSTDYLKYSFCSPDTCSNAISMWYGAYRVKYILEQYMFTNSKHYDVIFRMRPDTIYHQKIDLQLVKDAVTSNSIYMPQWHGKYEPVTRQMMDQFAFGDFKNMKIYLGVFENIDQLLSRETSVHTGEGLLYEQIKMLSLIRFKFHYSLVRDTSIDRIV